VGAVLPRAVAVADDTQPGFMDQGRGLQRLPGGLPGHSRCRVPAQFIINEWQQSLGGTALAPPHGLKYLRDFGHELKRL
jgi:hypothetical protein